MIQKLVIAAQQDQDMAACHEFVRVASEQELIDIWNVIQQPFDDPVMELVSRFAQIGFSQAVLDARPAPMEDGR